MNETVLCYIKKKNEYLMLYRNKKEKDINEGKWIGVGGHLELNETKLDALYREVKEETNLDILDYKYLGDVYFYDNSYSELMHLYVVLDFKGSEIFNDEGTFKWINKKDILSLNLFEGDKIFLKRIIDENYDFFKLELYYDNGILKEMKFL